MHFDDNNTNASDCNMVQWHCTTPVHMSLLTSAIFPYAILSDDITLSFQTRPFIVDWVKIKYDIVQFFSMKVTIG